MIFQRKTCDFIVQSVCVFLLGTAAFCQARVLHVSLDELDGISKDVQFRTVGEAVSQIARGDTVMIHSGVYREKIDIEKSGTAEKPIVIRAAEGEHVVLTGADRLTQWQKEGQAEVFSTEWQEQFLTWTKNQTHPSDDYHLLIGRCEQVSVNGYLLRQVLEKDKISRGTFFVDTKAKRLYICDSAGRDVSNAKYIVEASKRNTIIRCKGRFVRIEGIRFRYAANAAQHGAVEIEGDDCIVKDCVFENTNSCGAEFNGERIVVSNCVFQYNGQLGFVAGRAHGLRMTGCVIRNNNVKGYDRQWEAGGNKIVFTRNAVIENSIFVENRGNGIWFDIDNEDCEVRNCFIAYNENAGIFYEISFRLFAHDNVIVGNGLAHLPGAWGANAGISISSSPGCVIERNLLVGNKEGFSFREQKRTTPLIDGGSEEIWNHDNTIRNNVFAYNRDAQVWGWFAIDDQRHWPRSMQDRKTVLYKGLSLEKLNLKLESNLYSPGVGQGLFNWGVTWKKHKKYADLNTIRKELSITRTSKVSDFSVKNLNGYDYRIAADSAAIKMKCYPQGKVPGVVLGTFQD